MNFFLNKFNLKYIFKNTNAIYYMKKQKVRVLNYSINRKLKKLFCLHADIRLPFFFFNKRKKKTFNLFISLFVNFFKLEMNKSQFLSYWNNFYIYTLKRIYIFSVYIMKKLVLYFFLIYKLFIKLVKLRTDFNKGLFFLYFFYKENKGKFHKKFKIYSIIEDIYKILNFNLYKKNNYHFFIFFKKNKSIYVTNYIKKELIKLKKIQNIRILVNLKFVFFLILVQSIMSWLNSFLFLMKVKSHNLNYGFSPSSKVKNLVLIFNRSRRPVHFNFLKRNYYLYDTFNSIKN